MHVDLRAPLVTADTCLSLSTILLWVGSKQSGKLPVSIKKKIKPVSTCDQWNNPCYSMVKAKHCRRCGNHRPIHICMKQPSAAQQHRYLIPERSYAKQAWDLDFFRSNTARAEPIIICLQKLSQGGILCCNNSIISTF